MEFRKIGIATCVGLLSESRKLGKILRNHGFEVFGTTCKCGEQKKESIDYSAECNDAGLNMCNPILQAKILNKEKTDLNIVTRLCVGHDRMFYKYSDAPVITTVVKDRVLGHNPVAAIYQLDSYYKKLGNDSDELK